MALVIARLEAEEPFDSDTGLPEFWAVVSSTGQVLGRYPATAKTLAELFVVEFNVKAFDVRTRLCGKHER